MLKNNIYTTKPQGELEAIPQWRKCNEEFGSWKELERLCDGRGSGGSWIACALAVLVISFEKMSITRGVMHIMVLNWLVVNDNKIAFSRT